MASTQPNGEPYTVGGYGRPRVTLPYQANRVWNRQRQARTAMDGSIAPPPDYDTFAAIAAEAANEEQLSWNLVHTLPQRANPGWGARVPLNHPGVGGEQTGQVNYNAQVPAMLWRRPVGRVAPEFQSEQ